MAAIDRNSSGGNSQPEPVDSAVSQNELREANRRLLDSALDAQEQADDSNREHAEIRALISGLAEGVIVLSELRDMVLFNPAAEVILGVADAPQFRPDLQSLRMRRLDGSALSFAASPVGRAVRGEVFSDEEAVIVDGERERHVVFSANCLRDAEGRVQSAILTCRDVSQLRELEKLREDYLALISHDLRNPLAIIQGAVQRLTQDPMQENDIGRAEMITLIQSSAERMSTLIGEVMESAQLESGQFKIEQEPVSLVPLVRAVLNRVAIGQDLHRLRMESPAQMELVMGDGPRIERLLVNLLTNALKYSEDGSPIVVTLQASIDEIIVSVRDEGRGISADHLPYIFDRFYRAGTTKAPAASFGLGLYIARLIAEAHGGRIWVGSDLGAGSTFSFALPTGSSLTPGQGV